MPAGTELVHPQFGMLRFEWPEGGVEFQLPHGEWIDLLRANGFEIERLIEIQAPADAETHDYYAYVTAEWAKQWPCGRDLGGSKTRVMPLVLASTSPQRRAILEQLAIPFEVVVPAFDEAPDGDPLDHAAGKARSVDGAGRPVLGVDTIVVCDGRRIGKPRDIADAARDARGARRPDARGRLGPLPAHA